jgi:uncharacterized protein (DUF1800 family)
MRNRRLAALIVLIALSVSASVWAGAKKQKKNKRTKIAAAQQMDEHQRAVHVLDRFTFGPRPGDVDRVAGMGVDKWFEEQLNPGKIDDSQLEARLQPLRSLNMTSAELLKNFPPPQVIKAVEQGRMGMPRDPAERAIYEAQIQKDQQRQELKQAKASDGTVDAGTQNNMMDDAQAQRRQDRQMARSEANRIMDLPPEQRFAAVLKMPPEQRDLFARSLNPQQREQIMNSLTPQQREQVMAMNNPQQVVTTELMQGKILRAAYSERQLQEVMTDFWFNHFNVFIGKGPDRFMITQYENQVIRPHSLGKFKDLLVATAQSPAMLFYLDNWQSVGPDSIVGQGGRMQAPPNQNRAGWANRGPGMRRNGGFGFPRGQQQRRQQQPRPQQAKQQQQRRGINENYAREIMELHTLGVDGGYTQKDVTELAKVLTGWTIREPRQGGEFYFNERMHEPGTKVVLGHKIKDKGEKEGMEMLDVLAHSPATAHHISLEIAQRFVSDNPPEALVDRMAKTFLKSDGDIREVLRTMYQSPEFWSADTVRAKVKTPLEFVASAIRATGANVTSAMPLVQTLNQMGMPLYGAQPPTGYSMKAETWVNSAALLNRMNFALRLASGKLPGVQFTPDALLGGEPPTDSAAAVAQLEQALLAGDVSKQTHETIMKQMTDPEVTGRMLDDPKRPVNVGVIAGLILGSPEFQRR